MIKAIIFDCFGVLAEDGWLPFKRRYIGKNTELAEKVAELGKQNDFGLVSHSKYFKKAAELIGVDQQTLRDAVSKQVPNADLLNYIKVELKPKYKIGLLSNANYDVVHKLFTPAQAELFNASAMSYETRLVKPDPRMFELIAIRLEVDASECIVVDDVERYCMAAKDFGMEAIRYKSFEQFKAEIKERLMV